MDGNRRARTRTLLENLTSHDSRQIYRAIQLAKAGGLGQVEDMDIHSQPPENILDAMRIASAWDDIAAEYINGFCGVFAMAGRLKALRSEADGDWLTAICRLQVERLAEYGDSLIARKNDASIVEKVKQLAKAAIRNSTNDSMTNAYAELDTFLRADGHRRNPGTTADLLAAATFIAMLERTLSVFGTPRTHVC